MSRCYRRVKNRLRFNLMPFLSYKAALEWACSIQQQPRSQVSIGNCLGNESHTAKLLEKRWNRDRKKLCWFTWASKRYKVLRLKHYYFRKWLATETENNSLLLASVKTLISQHIKAAFQPYWWLIGGEAEAQGSFCNQHPGQEEKTFSRLLAWNLPTLSTLNISIPLAGPLPPQDWKLFQLVPRFSPVNWNWVPKAQW